MRILHVNRSMPRNVSINGKEVATGIYKEAATGPVHVRRLGLDGDGQADLTVHGGPYQAVYAYPVEHYARWQNELQVGSFPPGTFGENLTVSGLLETDVCVGDVHRMGEVTLQVTSPRIPCFKLGHKLNRPDILKPFLRSGCCGFYYRVLEEGPLVAGVDIEIASLDPRKVTVRELLGIYRLGEGTRERIECALEIEALSPIVRKDLHARLAKEE